MHCLFILAIAVCLFGGHVPFNNNKAWARKGVPASVAMVQPGPGHLESLVGMLVLVGMSGLPVFQIRLQDFCLFSLLCELRLRRYINITRGLSKRSPDIYISRFFKPFNFYYNQGHLITHQKRGLAATILYSYIFFFFFHFSLT